MSYYNSIVSNSEQEALKEMIFNRVKERAKSLAEDVQTSYTTAMQDDIMDLARNSFAANKNPFSIEKTESKGAESSSKNKEIGFPKRDYKEVKSQLVQKNKVINSDIAASEVQLTMANARDMFEKRQSFTGALEFLNSQATIALVQNKGKYFEALA